MQNFSVFTAIRPKILMQKEGVPSNCWHTLDP